MRPKQVVSISISPASANDPQLSLIKLENHIFKQNPPVNTRIQTCECIVNGASAYLRAYLFFLSGCFKKILQHLLNLALGKHQ